MKKIHPFVYILGLAMILATLYVLFSNPDEEVRNRKVTANIASVDAPISISDPKSIDKLQLLEKSEQEREEKLRELERVENQDPIKFTATLSDVIKDDVDKALEKKRTTVLQPVYKGKTYRDEQTQDDQVEVSTKPMSKPIKQATVAPLNSRKAEIETPKPNSHNKEVFAGKHFGPAKKETAAGSSVDVKDASMFKAAVFGSQEIKAGADVRFRTLEEVEVNGTRFPRNTIFYGKAGFGPERLFVTVSKLAHQGSIVHTNFVIHDAEMNEGLYAPVNVGKQATSHTLNDGVSNIVDDIGGAAGVIGNSISTITRSITGNRVEKIKIPDGEQVVFVAQAK